MMFEDFDFNLLESPDFKEDSVREELIHPLLRRLGYSASPPNQITRSPTLLHPYVYIGSKKNKVHIIPDYLIKRDDKPFFVVDAKGPSEEILTGSNVEQAYSYAIHKDIRVEMFALCNGRHFALFHVSHWPALLDFPLSEVDESWPILARYIGTNAVRREVTFFPDLGIGMTYLGFAVDSRGHKIVQIFATIEIHLVARVDDETYSIQSHIGFEETFFLGTFDFKRHQVDEFIQHVEPERLRDPIRDALRHNPFTWRFDQGGPGLIGFSCQLGDDVHHNENEQYIPFIVERFI
jgi:hypothetical protein